MKKNEHIIKTKIFRNLFLSFASGVLVIIFFFALLVVSIQKNSIIEIMHSEAMTLSNSIDLVCADAMVSEDDSFIVEHNMAVAQKNRNILSIIVTKKREGHIYVTHNEWKLLDKLPQKYSKMEQSKPQYKVMGSEFHYVQPIIISGIDWGWVHTSYTLDQYHKKLSALYNYIALLIVAIFITVLLVSFYIAKYISKPILKLKEGTNAVAEGDLTTRIELEQRDEISDLAENFNYMTSRLEAADKRLQKSHSDLERMVKLRTKELEDLNRDLDYRVKYEVEKNREQEQILIQQSRSAAMGEMIGNIAHQWRQPLNALNLVIQNIYFSYEANELNEAILKRSVQKSQRLVETMSHTIDDFRNFFQPNKMVEEFTLIHSINTTLELISASLKNHNIMIHIDVDETIHIKGYPNELSQVLLNLLSNAKDVLIENHVENAQITIAAQQKNGEITIEIEDNGGGIDDIIIQKVFDPYFSTKEEGKGTGIGLYMSKVIIENNMHGTIHVKNAKEGACFTITLKDSDVS
jgi:signal transduction histidine kinase